MKKAYIIHNYTFLFVAVLILSGCGIKLPGKLYLLQNGTVMDFQIETSQGTGDMYAFNHITGENFTGQYTGTYKGGGVSRTTTDGNFNGSTSSIQNGFSNFSGNISSTSSTFTPPSDATARGVLIGDKGTVIELYMEIRPGIRPKGHGEGIDNKGNKYQVQF